MANPKDLDAALALWRFGLGAKAGSIGAIKPYPRDLLQQEITEKAVPRPVGAGLLSSRDLLLAFYDYQDQVKAERERPLPAALEPTSAPAAAGPGSGSGSGPNSRRDSRSNSQTSSPGPQDAQAADGPASPGEPMAGATRPVPERGRKGADSQGGKRPFLPQQILLQEADARFNGTIHEPLIGFGERLAMFFANHFAIAAGKSGEVRVLAGCFEREAIRPHLFGRFEDLLVAVETHPAMLIFLDNRQSIGPRSPANRNGKRGLNENLAREILELHTLGVDGGYSQADVTAFARIITGWTVNRNEKRPGPLGVFSFNERAHEPGDHAVLGTTYAEGGFNQGRAVLRDLARHPATARHLAYKLARHFVADQPPPSLVAAMTAAYTKTEGDLSAVYTAMISAEEAWEPRLTKMRPPLQYVTAVLRASGIRPKPRQIVSTLKALGQPLWNPAGPNGFPDVTDGWASPEGLATRIETANLFAHQVQGKIDPRTFAGDRFGPLLSDETLQAISRAETRAQGLSLAFLSPECVRS
ncbi:DUF1800 domain-containing protein [Rhizobium sp. SSA_523]|uniref:DUF1800 domain-containing protein n=1 Tax=Rhizobium sp. SSA_523 TaxID=2952477 RepID=UPI002090EE6A|nr:DUF1800 family protein [Rhizobium sp. SSA_523]MCO5730994.1 DUF1800 family protein [Rhizobium sp. SSA_523]WKC24201.1 DUF1800 family protein [Rhizobium sp. SSA_523]